MKNQVVIIFWLFAISVANGQNKNAFLYGSISAGGGTHDIFHLSLETMVEKKHHLAITHFATKRNASNVPEDYKPGLVLNFWGSDYIPDIKSCSYSFVYGRVIPTKSKMIRFVLDAGLGFAITQRPVGFKRIEKPEFLGPNYTYSKENSTSLNLVIAPKIEIPLLRFVGLSTGPVANINSKDSAFGWILSLNIGLLRGKKY